MSIEENKAIVRRLIEEAWNNKNLAVADEIIAPDAIYHANGPVGARGPEGIKEAARNWLSYFPDLAVTVAELSAADDLVTARYRGRGTHQGAMSHPYLGVIAPTGKPVRYENISISRLADGKIVEIWEVGDFLGLLQQMGAIPIPAVSGK